ncbi:hypothetical protein BC628DRAFT_1420311 [Trametes gibbosa]|nr:hypothetical protein BC628DRAFT_1420311 [Trametes gibbosa]
MFGFLTSWIVTPRRPPPPPPPHIRTIRTKQDSPDTCTSSHPWPTKLVPVSHIHPALGSDALDTNVSQSSFFRALNAPYINPRPPPQRHAPHQSKCRATVDWRTRPSLDADSSDDDEDMDAPAISDELLDRFVYEPVAKWGWTKGHPVVDAMLLSYVYGDSRCAMTVMKGKISGNEITYMCKSWSRASRLMWQGFYSELQLYSSPKYLRNLQGRIVPNVINLYDGPTAISLLMELPHHSFWMEASADMPNVLKKSVIHCYVILHSRGILHGEPELRNMLIGGDGRVTLVNFHAARAREPMPQLGLQPANRNDFALELRQVMYKLDYEGARVRENAKMKRFLALEKHNKDRRARGGKEEKPMLEEVTELPPAPDAWRKRWINNLDAAPRRHVVPGQSPDEVERCLESFRALIEVLAELDAKDATSPLIRLARRPSSSSTPPPSPPFAQPNPRKRKTSHSEDDSDLPWKRIRGDKDTVEHALPPPMFAYTSKVYNTGTSSTLLRASSTQNAEPKVHRVRDFAYEPYDGPRGYYFPHPPTEALRDMMRAAQIRNANAIACGEQGLPYFRWDRWHLRAPAFKRAVPKGMSVSLGALKRQRAAAENPLSPYERRTAKKRQFEADRAAALAEERAVRFDDQVTFQDPPDDVDYAGCIVDETPAGSSSQSARRTAAKPSRSILKPTIPVKTISYDLALWPSRSSGADDQSCDASGPAPLQDDATRACASPFSQPHISEGPGRAITYIGIAGSGAGSAPVRYGSSIADDGAGRAALSSSVAPSVLDHTHESAPAASMPWRAPFAMLPLACGPDTPTLVCDYRVGEEGAWSDHAPSSEEDELMELEDMEVEAMLFSENERAVC